MLRFLGMRKVHDASAAYQGRTSATSAKPSASSLQKVARQSTSFLVEQKNQLLAEKKSDPFEASTFSESRAASVEERARREYLASRKSAQEKAGHMATSLATLQEKVDAYAKEAEGRADETNRKVHEVAIAAQQAIGAPLASPRRLGSPTPAAQSTTKPVATTPASTAPSSNLITTTIEARLAELQSQIKTVESKVDASRSALALLPQYLREAGAAVSGGSSASLIAGDGQQVPAGRPQPSSEPVPNLRQGPRFRPAPRFVPPPGWIRDTTATDGGFGS